MTMTLAPSPFHRTYMPTPFSPASIWLVPTQSNAPWHLGPSFPKTNAQLMLKKLCTCARYHIARQLEASCTWLLLHTRTSHLQSPLSHSTLIIRGCHIGKVSSTSYAIYVAPHPSN